MFGFLTLKIGAKVFHVEYNDIFYIKSDGNYCDIFFTNGEPTKKIPLKLKRMGEIIDENVSPTPFVRVGKRLIINLNYLYCIDFSLTKSELKSVIESESESEPKAKIILSYGGSTSQDYDVFRYAKYYEKDGKLCEERDFYPGHVVRRHDKRTTVTLYASRDALSKLRNKLLNNN